MRMALVNDTVTATTTAAALPRPDSVSKGSGNPSIEIKNTGAVVVYVGGSDIEGDGSVGGTAVPAGGQWVLSPVTATDAIYVIAASSTAVLEILWTGV